jgi:hypothetical protein
MHANVAHQIVQHLGKLGANLACHSSTLAVSGMERFSMECFVALSTSSLASGSRRCGACFGGSPGVGTSDSRRR